MDSSLAPLVEATIERAQRAYDEIGKPLPFEAVTVNPTSSNGREDEPTLRVYVVPDANAEGVDASGCALHTVDDDEPLDALSVRGGCVVVGSAELELRCSAKAVALFSDIGGKVERSNPALLYVLAHELGHVHQRMVGEYEGRVTGIDLSQPRATKLLALQASCEPASTKREEEADALAVDVMKLLWKERPYKEPLFSDRGSLLWNVDQLVIAANEWQRASLAQEFISRSAVHRAFVPTEFPTPKLTIEANARGFVCDVLNGSSGMIQHPLQSTTHPSLHQRMGRVAEAMRPIAAELSDDTRSTTFESVAQLQNQLSPILSHIYRETAAYMEDVHDAICTMVNAETPPPCG